MSLNQFQLIGDVHTQLYTPLHEQSYYSISSGRNISYLTEEILTNLDPDINFAQYDTRSPGSTSPDGIVDMIFICFRTWKPQYLDADYYQGYASLTGSYGTFGSGSQYLTLDGKQIRAGFPGSGTIQNDILCLHDIGIIVHEYGHYLFGGIHYTGIGYWGLMDGKGTGPMCALERAKTGIGWITPTLITSNTNDLLQDAITTGDANKIEVTPGTHYFLAENRQLLSYYESSWRQYNGGPLRLAGPGLLITHVTYGSNIDVECADKKWDWQKSGSNYVYPFVALNPNPFTGLDEMELREVQTTAGKQSHPDWLADANDSYKLDVYTMFSPWSNPNSNSIGGYGADKFSDKAIILKSMNGNNMSIDFYTTLENTTFSASTEATALNNQRKLCATSDGRIHMVFESEGEIFYRRTTTNGTTLENSTSVKLSTGNYNNKCPSISERSGTLYVVWQRKNGSTHDILYRSYASGSWSSITTLASSVGSSDPLPVIVASVPSHSLDLMVVYRGTGGLKYRRYTGGSWQAAATVSGTTGSSRNPSLVYKSDGYAYYNLTWDNGSQVYHQQYYGSNWGSATQVSQTWTNNNQYSSYALAGSLDRHIVWQAQDWSHAGGKQVVMHNKNLNPTVFSEFYDYRDYLRPTGSGHSSGAFSVVWHDAWDAKNIRKAYYNGNSWVDGQFGVVIGTNGADASLSVANPPGATAKAVWRSAGSAPYTLTLGPSGGLGKGLAEENFAYHRRSIYSMNSTSVLSLQMSSVKVISGAKNTALAFPFVSDDQLLTSNQLQGAMTIANIQLPVDADSLAFTAGLYNLEIGALSQDGKTPVEVSFELVPENVKSSSQTITFKQVRTSGESYQAMPVIFPVQSLRGEVVTLRPVLSNLAVEKCQGALVHVYVGGESGMPKVGEQPPLTIVVPLPMSYEMKSNYPNPFNPETSIEYSLPQGSHVRIDVYNVLGQRIITLVDGQMPAGNHSARWNGRNAIGEKVSAGICLCRMQAGEFVKT